jgi:hypothetical protein
MKIIKKCLPYAIFNFIVAVLTCVITAGVFTDYGWLGAGGITFVIMSVVEFIISRKKNTKENNKRVSREY